MGPIFQWSKILASALKFMHDDNNTIYFFPIRCNNNVYPSVYNNWVDGYFTIITDDRWLCDTAVPDNNFFGRNSLPAIINPVLLSLHIGYAKRGIYSIKTDTCIRITIHKMNGKIFSNKNLDVMGDKGETHFLSNVNYKVIVL